MRAALAPAFATGVLVFVVLRVLGVLHVGEPSGLRAAIVAGLSAALVRWSASKIPRSGEASARGSSGESV